jgi:hypothetical protein
VALCAGAVRADYPATVLNLNPIAYYRLGELAAVPADTAANLGSGGVTGTGFYINDPSRPTAGALVGSADTAVNLDGTRQRLAVPYDSSINPTGPFTAEAWVNASWAQTGTGVVCPLAFWSQPASGRTGWLIYQGSTGWNLRMYDGITTSQTVDITGGGAPEAGVWYHLAVVYDGTNAHFYVNGVSAGERSARAYVPNASGPFSIGARSDGNFWFPGSVDEVALYATALSGTEILAHYQNGTNPTPSPSYNTLVLARSPVLYFRMGEPPFTPGAAVTAVNLGNLSTGADGTYEAGALTGVDGPPFAGFGPGNTAMRISSIAGDVLIPEQPVNTDQFTITCWFKRSGAHAAGQALVFNRRADQGLATGLGFGYNGSPGVDQLNVHWNEGPSGWQTGLIPPNDVWCFAAAVYTPTGVTVYLDQLSATYNTSLAPHDFSIAPTYIGWDFPYTRFSGAIDEVALFDRALTPAEIQTLFAASQMPPQFLTFTRTPADPLFEGYNITMTATTGGITPITYQWYKDSAPIPGQTTATLSIPNATVGTSGLYTLVAANAYGSTTSAVQNIRVSSGPPSILSQSIFDATRAAGGWVTYSVVAGGSAPISYQWKKGGTPIPGATSSSLKLANVQPADAGVYSVTLTNPYGTTNSTAGTLAVFTVTHWPYAALYYQPLAYYRLAETSGTRASDHAGGFHGTINGSMALSTPGPQAPEWGGLESTNVGFQFDGTSTRVQLPSFNLKTNQITIVAWINPAGPQKDQTGILASRTSAGLAGFFVNRDNSDALSYVWEGTDSWWAFKSGLVPAFGQWNFVALVIDPSQGTVYLDDGTGTGLQSATYTPSQGNKTVPWDSPNIGVDLGYDRWFNGAIDEVVVYDRALSFAEIYNLDLLGKSWPGPAPQLIVQPASTTVFPGESARFDVSAVGALPLNFAWRHSNTNLPGATTPTLAIPNVDFPDAGTYLARVTNPVGTTDSNPATLAVVPPPTFANLTNDLVLHLTFDGNYEDVSGRGNHASPVGAPTLVPGRLGQAMHYNTDNSDPGNVIYNYATLGTPADLQFGSGQNFSVSYWIRFTGTSVDLPVLCNNDCGEGCTGFYFGPSWHDYAEGSWAWAFAENNAGLDMRGAAHAIDNGQWHNVVSTFDRAGQAITYLDGEQVHVAAIDRFTASLDTWFPVNVGQTGSGAYNVVFSADVDDLGIWLRVLTPVEARSIFRVAQHGSSFDSYGPVLLALRRAGSDLELIWQAGTLLSATAVNGTYAPVSGARAPYYRVTPTAAATYYRVRLD